MDDRRLQHASLALEKDHSEESSLFFPYLVLGLGCVIGGVVFLQLAHQWVCLKYFGREDPVEPLSGEEILAGLSEEQRRAVLQAIYASFCKAATESDISQRKPMVEPDDCKLPIQDIEISDKQIQPKEEEDSQANGDASLKDSDPVGNGEKPMANSPSEGSNERAGSGIEADIEDELNVSTHSSSFQTEAIHGNSPRDMDCEKGIPIVGSATRVEERRAEDAGDGSSSQFSENGKIQEEVAISMQGGIKEQVSSESFHPPCDIEAGLRGQDATSTGIEKDEENPASDCDGSACSPYPPLARCPSTLSDDSSYGHVCPICLGSYEKGSVLFISKHCNHVFHMSCILEWLTKHDDCPTCRVKMVTHEEMVKAAMALVQTTTRR